MMMPGRKYVAGSVYRYGFNGKENDNDVKGEGNQQDYGFRIYESRLGRFLSVDPLSKSFPWNSPYAFAENDVLRNIDLDGEEKKNYILVWDEKHEKATLKYSHDEDFFEDQPIYRETTSFGMDGEAITYKIKTGVTKVKNPRVEYVVHGDVTVPYSETGMFQNEVQSATWTFKTSEKMFQAQNRSSRIQDGPNKGNERSDFWWYATSDQSGSIAWAQAGTYLMEAQAQKTVFSPNFKKPVAKTTVIPTNQQANTKASTLRPGLYAKESIPAKSTDQHFTLQERASINLIGNANGCHTCGTKIPGTKSGNWVPDHQPSSAISPPGTQQVLLPHCIGCSRRQGGEVSVEKKKSAIKTN